MQLKWIVLASICSFAVISIGRSMVSQTPDERMAYIHASYPTRDACLTGTAERMAPCTVPGCYNNAYVFLDQCLIAMEGEGDFGEFCRNVQYQNVDSVGRDIFTTHCEPHMPYEDECWKLIGRVGNFCANPLNK